VWFGGRLRLDLLSVLSNPQVESVVLQKQSGRDWAVLITQSLSDFAGVEFNPAQRLPNAL
jgi:hypothetical protein